MKKQKSYCCYCGGAVSRKFTEGRLRDSCGICGTVFYENPLPVACCIVANDNREILLVKRKKDPYMDMWCLPIGFAESGEEVSQAAQRELTEETGLTGEIHRLIDVDTVENYYYGSLAIVTYEVRATGGMLAPGDDASDAAFFPIQDLPQLAWTSNAKAIDIYRRLYRDTWAMVDSFRQLFPEGQQIEGMSDGPESAGAFLSNLLVKLIDVDKNEICGEWIRDVVKSMPLMDKFMDILMPMNARVLDDVRAWLKGGEINYRVYAEIGKDIRARSVRLPDMLTALALSRKSIWVHVIKKRILFSPLEIYSTLELNNRIIFFYDRINYFIAEGYGS